MGTVVDEPQWRVKKRLALFPRRTTATSWNRIDAPTRPASGLFRRWPTEPRRVDGDVRVDLAQLRRVTAVEPRELVLEWKLDAANVAIVAVVDLRRHPADRRRPVAHYPGEEVGF